VEGRLQVVFEENQIRVSVFLVKRLSQNSLLLKLVNAGTVFVLENITKFHLTAKKWPGAAIVQLLRTTSWGKPAGEMS
jgi:hypothetical protein